MPGVIPSQVCREHGISTGQLYTWRKQFRSGELTGFAPVTVTPARDQLPEPNIPVEAPSPMLAPAAVGIIEVELPSGVKLRLTGDIAEPLLRRVLAALR
jgi:transposase